MQQQDLFSSAGPTRPLTVSQLTAEIKDRLESDFSDVWVVGEIGDLARPRSGHCYLTLKDDAAQLRAVLWRGVASRLRFDLHDGLEVLCRGHLDVYAPRGSYQLIVDQIEPKGIGALELAFRQLREKLAKEGLFDADRKRPLPRFMRRIGVVTSPTGAAIHDFLQVLARRWRGADVLIVPARVQGEGSIDEVVTGIELLNRVQPPVDCIVVTRGGGSLEDLWTFNEERVVRAIAASQTPVVSAIGHEIDVTLSDLAADVRALTPSEAAERVVPAVEEVAAGLRQRRDRLAAAMRARLMAARSRLDSLGRQRVFRRPFALIQDAQHRLDELDAAATRTMRQRLDGARHKLGRLAAQLESLSPLAVLGRGYSLTQRADGTIVRSAADLSLGELLDTRLAQGRVHSRVEQLDASEPQSP